MLGTVLVAVWLVALAASAIAYVMLSTWVPAFFDGTPSDAIAPYGRKGAFAILLTAVPFILLAAVLMLPWAVVAAVVYAVPASLYMFAIYAFWRRKRGYWLRAEGRLRSLLMIAYADRRNLNARKYLYRAEMDRLEFERAERWLGRAEALAPEDLELRICRVEHYVARKRPREAEAALKRLAEAAPQDGRVVALRERISKLEQDRTRAASA